MYVNLDIIHPERNKLRSDFKYFLLEAFFDMKRWVHANPTLYQRDDSYKKYFVGEYADGYCDDLLGYTVADDSHFIILQGKRGSGKTSLVNYFLNKHTRELNQKGFTWVRIDCTKIFKNEFDFNKSLDFEEYLLGQLLFVYFRYRGNGGVCKSKINHHAQGDKNCSTPYAKPKTEIIDGCDEALASVDLESLVKFQLPHLRETYHDIRKKAEETPHYNNGLEGKPFFHREIATLLLEQIKDKIILVIDGLDNISYTSIVKNKVWKNLKNFLESEKDKDIKFHKIILSLRNENYEILSKKLPFLSEDGAAVQGIMLNFVTIDTPAQFKSIVEKFEHNLKNTSLDGYDNENYRTFLINLATLYKHYLAKSKFHTALKSRYENEKHKLSLKDKGLVEKITKIESVSFDELELEEIERLLGQEVFVSDKMLMQYLRKCGKAFENELEKSVIYLYKQEETKPNTLKKRPIHHYFIYAKKFEEAIVNSFKKQKAKIPQKILRDFFNNDLREMTVLSYKTYIDFTQFERHNRKPGDPDNFSDFIDAKFLIIMQSIFKNGNQYMIDRSDVMFHPPYRNINIINLLNVSDKRTSRFSPLYYFYILDFIKVGKTFEKIAQKFQLDGKKDEVLLKETLENFLEFGYCDLRNNEGRLTYRRTDKGAHILAYSLKNITTLHIYLFGGLIDERFERFFSVQADFSTMPDYNIYDERKFASAIQLNLSMLYYMLTIDQGELNAKGISQHDFDIKLITDMARESFKGYYDTNPHLFKHMRILFQDIEDTITPKNDTRFSHKYYLHQNIANFVNEKILNHKKYIDDFKDTDKRFSLMKKLDKKERYAFLRHFLAGDIDQVIDDGDMHYFVFEGYDPRKKEERKKFLKSFEYIVYLDSLREKLKETNRR